MIKKIIFAVLLLHSVNGYTQNRKDEAPLSMDSLFRAKARESIGKPFPAFTAFFNGHSITKDSLNGNVVFINFWFEACPPCIAELPALNELYKKMAVFSGVEFLSFTYESPAKIRLLKKKYNIKYKVSSVSRQECYRLNQNNGFPTSIILDKEGVIKDLFTGGTTSRKEAAIFMKTTVLEKIIEVLKTN